MSTEKRLIDANELLEKHTCDVYGAYDDSCMVQAVFVPYIKGAPTVDAVEVVRCKDCRHYRHFKGCGNWCHRRLRSDIEFKVKPNDFCSYGERRTDGRRIEI